MWIEFEAPSIGGGKQNVSGFQVGRFAVVHDPAGRRIQRADGSVGTSNAKFFVDHIPSGVCVCSLVTGIDALVVADDISRFARSDPDSKDPMQARNQVGPIVDQWMRLSCAPRVSRGLPVLGFREWLAEQKNEQ